MSLHILIAIPKLSCQ